jgi:hypothetical protein
MKWGPYSARRLNERVWRDIRDAGKSAKSVNSWYLDRSVPGVLFNRKTSRSLDNISIKKSTTFAEGYVVQSGR